MKIHILDCGYIRIGKKLLDCGGRFSTNLAKAMMTPDSDRVTLPVCAYLIEHSSGLYLVDTGWSREISPSGVYDRSAARKVLPEHLAAMYRPFVPAGMTVREQLSARGIMPGDLKAVLITHFDADHVAGLRSVSGAKSILVPEDEAYWSVRTKYRIRQIRELWETVDYKRLFYRGFQLGPANKGIDISGDGSIMMVSLPGHTDGQAGVLLKEGGRYVLIAGDAALSSHNWESMSPSGFGAEEALQKKTLRWLAETAKDPFCVKILCSHDADMCNGTVEL